jgi:hypothetical protein
MRLLIGHGTFHERHRLFDRFQVGRRKLDDYTSVASF